MADPYLDALAAEARCFGCLPEALHREIQTYIIVTVAELDPDPNVLMGLAKCLRCLDSRMLSAIRLYLLHAIGGRDLDAEAIAASGACWGCTSSEIAAATQTYLLSLDDFGPGTSDTAELIRLSKAFRGMPPRTLLEIQVYALAINAGNVDSSITTDPATLAGLAKCLCLSQQQIEAGTTEAIEWLEPLPDVTDPPLPPVPPGRPSRPVVPRPERPPTPHHPDPPAPPTRPGVRGCTDVMANWTPVATPVYGADYELDSITVVIPKACCSATSTYNLYGSDNFDLSDEMLLDNAHTGGNHGQVNVTFSIDMTGFTKNYYRVTQVCDGPEGDYSNVVARYGDLAIGEDWADRVVANGGSRPSDDSILAASEFYGRMGNASLLPKMKVVNMIAPDSLIAAATPLIVGTGSDPWTNHNFLAADLSRCGLQPDGATKYFQTGIVPNVIFPDDTSGGATEYSVRRYPNTNTANLATMNAANTTHSGIGLTDGSLRFWSWAGSDATGYETTATTYNTAYGYFSANRTAANAVALYRATGVSAHAVDGTANTTSGSRPDLAYYAFAQQESTTAPSHFASAPLSLLAVHLGLTQAESAAFHNAIVQLRKAFGGGLWPWMEDDDMESYAVGAAVNGSNGPSRSAYFLSWGGAYVARTNFYEVQAGDDFESYTVTDPLNGLNGGTLNWAGAWVARDAA